MAGLLDLEHAVDQHVIRLAPRLLDRPREGVQCGQLLWDVDGRERDVRSTAMSWSSGDARNLLRGVHPASCMDSQKNSTLLISLIAFVDYHISLCRNRFNASGVAACARLYHIPRFVVTASEEGEATRPGTTAPNGAAPIEPERRPRREGGTTPRVRSRLLML